MTANSFHGVTIMMTWTQNSIERMRRSISDLAVQSLFAGMTGIGALDGGASAPWATHPNLRHYRDIPYSSQFSELSLDVHRPDASGRFPALVHIHGGAFRMMSKETHAHIADAYARGGFVVFNIDYRLGPEHPYPAPLEDVLRAIAWVSRHGDVWGADTDQIFLAGESAGANLAVSSSLVHASASESEFDVDLSDVRIGGLIAACGILEVSDHERFRDGTAYGAIVTSQLAEARDGYLRGVDEPRWANPLRVLDDWKRKGRNIDLPPVFAFAGTNDPLREDAAALASHWEDLGGSARHQTYDGQGHSFHAFMWRDAAQDAWQDQQDFLQTVRLEGSEEVSLRLVG